MQKTSNAYKSACIIISILAFLAFLFFSGENAKASSWHMVNVNHTRAQGDANLIITGNIVTMIDAGYHAPAAQKLIPYLKNLQIEKIHHFFISHPHRDHYEGMEEIQKAGIKIDNVYYSMPDDKIKDCCYVKSHFIKYLDVAKKRGAKLIEIGEGFSLKTSSQSKFEVLHAHKTNKVGNKGIDINDASLIIRWTINGHTVLFTGDLNKNLGTYLSDDPRMTADILKVPHHGGIGIAPDSFFDRVSPSLNMVPGPAWVWNGDRGKQPREWSIKNKVPFCVNGINGHVKIVFSDNINLESEQPTKNCKNGRVIILKKSKIDVIAPAINLILED